MLAPESPGHEHFTGHTACLAHLDDTDRDAYLTSLTPGAEIDHRGTPFTSPSSKPCSKRSKTPSLENPASATPGSTGRGLR
ncbi:hypothetical protein ACFV7R_43465 [Streptomyces sp. NPDC059866]|uniref:hypothetical protein n=1 Tax=Streptomyces sp. NPDC059866 TaxID=3346978 RepID=UPI00366351BD